MRAFELFKKLTLYYAALGVIGLLLISFIPSLKEYLPIGGAQSLLLGSSDDPFEAIEVGREGASTFTGSMIWMFIASCSALLTSLPVAWTYIASRKRDEYDNSIIRTIMVLPVLLTSIVLMVHNSLALAFSLAGIVGAVRFRNTLKSPGDALYVLMAIGIGLAAGIGAVEIAIIMSMVVNYCYVVLWGTEFGVEMKSQRYLRSPGKKLIGNSEEPQPVSIAKEEAVKDTNKSSAAP
jgi:hypothetical protein